MNYGCMRVRFIYKNEKERYSAQGAEGEETYGNKKNEFGRKSKNGSR